MILVALPIFGLRGSDGASTREIARAAGKPMSAITYHFGGKDGLYLACARHIAETIGGRLGRAVGITEPPSTKLTARAQLVQLLEQMTIVILHDDMADFARFIIREQLQQTEAFQIIYDGLLARVLERMVDLMRLLAGDGADEVALRVRVIALTGLVLAFRFERASTLLLTGWTAIGESERRVINQIIQANLTAILDGLEREHQP